MHWAFSGVTFHFCRNLAVGYNLRKPSVTACCFRRKVLFDMYAIQRPATLKWLRTQQSCGSAVFSIALCDTCVMRCTSQTADFVTNYNSFDLLAISSSRDCICLTDPSHFQHFVFNPFSVSNCNNNSGSFMIFLAYHAELMISHLCKGYDMSEKNNFALK